MSQKGEGQRTVAPPTLYAYAAPPEKGLGARPIDSVLQMPPGLSTTNLKTNCLAESVIVF